MLAWVLGTPVALVLVVLLAFQVSPWPGVLVIRNLPQLSGADQADTNATLVPDGIVSTIDEVYDADDPRGRLDVFHPAT